MDKKKAFCSKQSFETLQMSHASLKNVMLICRTEHAFCFLIPKMTTEVDVFNPISKKKQTYQKRNSNLLCILRQCSI